MRRQRFPVLRLLTVISVLAGLAMFSVRTGTVAAQAPFQVIARNLDNPRGLAFGSDGALYVAEAGRGGTAPCMAGGPEGGQVCYGASGAVTRIAGGRQERIVTGLASFAGADGSDATGPHDISLLPNGEAYLVVGWFPPAPARSAFGPAGANFGQLVRIDTNRQWQNVADLAAYEQANNPHPASLESNPYSVLALQDRRIVTDAAGNTLLEVAPDGAITRLAVFPSRVVRAPPIPNLPPEIPMEPVPTTVSMGPDGAYYVGELTGFPFPVGGARVYRVVPGSAPEVYAEGFTNIIDIAFGPDGSLYVLEFNAKGLLQAEGPGGDPSGALIRVAPDRSRTTIASQGLITPSSVAVGPDNALYVSNFGAVAGQGQVVRIEQQQAQPARPLPETAVESGSVTFPETGYSLDGDFLSYWNTHGGLPVFGYPITSAQQVDGQVAQWLERARFELHPENAAPYNVLLGRLGVDALARQGRDWQSFAKASPSAAHYFKETGHAITHGPFWAYWSSHGLEFDGRRGTSMAESLALFGYPISGTQMETNANGDTVLTQWFERARFEYHSNSPAPYKVLLGRLGAELRNERGR